jgi:hypothetical protein
MDGILNFCLKSLQEPGNFWAMLTAVTTVVLALIAYWQLGDLARTGKSDFLYKLKKDFFTDDARRLMFLIDNDLLEFCSEEISYFQILKPKSPEAEIRLSELGITGSGVSTYLIDDVLLGPLEDVGFLLKRDLLSRDEVYEQFDSYVQACGDNDAIRAYLKFSRTGEGNEDVYDGFQYLYDQLEKWGPKIRATKKNG